MYFYVQKKQKKSPPFVLLRSRHKDVIFSPIEVAPWDCGTQRTMCEHPRSAPGENEFTLPSELPDPSQPLLEAPRVLVVV